MKAKRIVCLLLISVVIFLCGCNAPQKDGIATTTTEDNLPETPNTQPATEPTTTQTAVEYCETFYSTDNSVAYSLDINEQISNTKMPVVEVAPYYLTGADAQRIANILFGDTDIYISKQRNDNVKYSKDEIQTKLQRWSEYNDSESVAELFGREQDDTVQIVRGFIEDYTAMLESAPDESQKELCSWDYMKESFYSLSEAEIEEQGTEQDNDAIKTELSANDICYAYNVVRRDKDDFKMSRISAYPFDGMSPDNIDEHIFTASLCRTEEPTAEEIENVKKTAEQMLKDMQLGEWQIDRCALETTWYGDIAEYVIHVTAVPVLEGFSANRRPQFRNLQSTEPYASNFYLTDVEFKFSAHGELAYFELNSPVQTVNIVKDSETLPIDTLMEKARQHLSNFDYSNFGLSTFELESSEEIFEEELVCNVSVNRMEYGLTRVNADTDDSYYYVPSLSLYGSAAYCGKDSGTVYFTSEQLFSGNMQFPLVVLNALDGSVVPLVNG